MQFETTYLHLPCGARAGRLELSGTISGEDTKALLTQLQPGGALYDLPLLITLQKVDSIALDARRVAGQAPTDMEPWEAVVVASPVLRVTVNFILRIQKRKKVKLFSGEPEAIQWLDARVREEMAAKRG